MIGIFDSGLGGLSALKEVRRLLPSEDIVYFGDTGRVPYGSRSKETIIKYALQDMNFLMSKNVDAVLVACGTVSSNAMDILRSRWSDIPIIGVIDSSARAAAKATENGIIGIAGTHMTIASGAFEAKLREINPGLTILPTPCPLFVSLVENGFISPDCEITRLTAEHYLAHMRDAGADTLILGCTHFPIIAGCISRVLPGVKLINVSEAAAAELCGIIRKQGSYSEGAVGKVSCFVSDEPFAFKKTASLFLGEDISESVERIDIECF